LRFFFCGYFLLFLPFLLIIDHGVQLVLSIPPSVSVNSNGGFYQAGKCWTSVAIRSR
jgi:hypothetical protein